jgi:hypothetical protein
MFKEYNFAYIRNPTTFFKPLWYTDRIHSLIMDFNILSSTSVQETYIETFDSLNTPEQRWIERQLKWTAIKDLYNYVLHANKDRKFIISFMKIETKSSKFGCRYEDGSWFLTYFADSEVPALISQDVLTVEDVNSYPFELNRLYELAENLNIYAIAFIEGIPNVV